MPPIRVCFYKDDDGTIPVLEWLRELRTTQPDGPSKCAVRMERLAALGHELRRPEADRVGENLYELRARYGRVNYRILYCFHGSDAAVLLHGFTKERRIPDADIARAQRRRHLFLRDPERHSYEEKDPP